MIGRSKPGIRPMVHVMFTLRKWIVLSGVPLFVRRKAYCPISFSVAGHHFPGFTAGHHHVLNALDRSHVLRTLEGSRVRTP